MRFLLPLALLVACEPGTNDQLADDYARVLPDERIEVNFDGAALRGVGDVAEGVELTMDATTQINGLVGDILNHVETIADFEPTWSDGDTTAVWGPWDEGPNQMAMWVHYDEPTDVYTWGFRQVPNGQADNDNAWVDILAGQVEAGATDIESEGWFVIDFTAIAELNPGEEQVGAFAVSYEVDDSQAVVTAAFEGWQETPSQSDLRHDVIYFYDQTHDGNGMMDLVYTDDETGNGDLETHLIRSRWQNDGAGRIDAAITGGELGDEIYFGTECWDTTQRVVFEGNTWDMQFDGDEDACVFTDQDLNDSHESDSSNG